MLPKITSKEDITDLSQVESVTVLLVSVCMSKSITSQATENVKAIPTVVHLGAGHIW